MSEFALAGDDLKRMVKVAKKQPLPFAYCPGSTPPEDLLAFHRTKSGEIMAKDLRASGEGGKVAFGMAAIDGNLMQLTCERDLPNIAKRIKKFLKLNKVSLNIQVMDADGNVVDSDIEELPEDLDDEDRDDAGAADGSPPSPDADDAPEAVADNAVLLALTDRFKAVQSFVASATGTNAEALRKVLASGIGLLRSGDLAQAEKAVLALENMQSRVPGAPPQPPTDDGAQRALAGRLQALAPRVAAAPPAMTDKLRASLTAAVGALRSGDLARAEQLVAAIETAMDRIGAAGDDALGQKQAKNEAQATIPQGTTAKRAFLVSRWAKIPRQIEVPMLSFCAEVAEQLPYEDPDELMTAASRYFGGLTETVRSAINDALDIDINAGDAAYSRTRQEIAAQRKVLDGDPVVSALMKTGLMRGSDLVTAFAGALADLDAELAN